MIPDLERLIRLQELENIIEDTRQTIEAVPSRREVLDTRIAACNEELATARQRVEDSKAARRAIEKDLAVVQGRLSKFKDQLMAVKTNKEYTAVQKEIAVAEHEVQSLEDQVLERMLQADELAFEVTRGENELTAEQAAGAQERAALDQESQTLERQLERSAEARSRLVGEIEPRALALFEDVARKRKGVVVAELRDGHCSFCNVRLRPQVSNEVRRNERLIQCESCLRILYFTPSRVQDPQL